MNQFISYTIQRIEYIIPEVSAAKGAAIWAGGHSYTKLSFARFRG
jgi:hypothetical protein